MSQFPETRISLIVRLAAADDAAAWREFATLYAPAVFALAQRRGLQPADAEDFVQELLLAVARAAGRWQPDAERARFRTWLYRVACNLLADHFRQRARCASQTSTESVSGQLIDPTSVEDLEHDFQCEYRRAMFHHAARLVQQRVAEATWRAFVATAVDKVPAATVSQQLGIPVGSVYVARSRTMKLLREEIQRIESSQASSDPLASDTSTLTGGSV